MLPVVDIFIPVIAGNSYRFPASIGSALTQTYPNIRLILFLDHESDILEQILKKWVYRSSDKHEIIEYEPNITIEYCTIGVIIRNKKGPSKSAGFTRQWIFKWSGISEYLKFLDSDDIIVPNAIETMMNHMCPECAGVLCPMIKSSSYRLSGIIDGKLELGHMGSGSILIKKEAINKMISEGFSWSLQSGHDRYFIEHLIAHKYNFITVPEPLYFYLK